MRSQWLLAALAGLALQRAASQDPVWASIPTQGSAPQSLDSPPAGCTCADSSRCVPGARADSRTLPPAPLITPPLPHAPLPPQHVPARNTWQPLHAL